MLILITFAELFKASIEGSLGLLPEAFFVALMRSLNADVTSLAAFRSITCEGGNGVVNQMIDSFWLYDIVDIHLIQDQSSTRKIFENIPLCRISAKIGLKRIY